MRMHDPDLPAVFTRSEAIESGLTPRQTELRVRSGYWRPLARGAYCLESTWAGSSPEGRQILGVTAVLKVASYPAWASHASAAALHQFPVPRDTPFWITRQPPGGTRYSDLLNVEAATIPLVDQWRTGGTPVTSRRRTIADCLRHLKPHHALAVLDAAAREDKGIITDVAAVLEYSADWPYAGRAALVLPCGDGRRESALESWSFWFMHRFGVPMPEPQVDIFDEFGRFLGRADAWWDEYKVAGEADGLTKYAVREGESVEDARRRLVDEKVREDAFRRVGAGVTRWGTRDLLPRPWAWSQDLMRALTNHNPREFRGYAVPSRPRAA